MAMRQGRAADPAQAIALRGHKHTVTCLVYAPRGDLLASGGKDGNVVLWDVAANKAKATLAGHKEMVTAVAFSPDGDAGFDGA
jgi:WD40 repeat protein